MSTSQLLKYSEMVGDAEHGGCGLYIVLKRVLSWMGTTIKLHERNFSVSKKYVGHERKHQWNILPWFSERNEAVGIGKPVPSSGEEMTDWNRHFRLSLCFKNTRWNHSFIKYNGYISFDFSESNVSSRKLVRFQQLTWLKLQDKQKLFPWILLLFSIKYTTYIRQVKFWSGLSSSHQRRQISLSTETQWKHCKYNLAYLWR